MSKAQRKSVYAARNTFLDRDKQEREAFAELALKVPDIDSALLLLHSNEDAVLVSVFRHITDFVRRKQQNLQLLREKNVLELLLQKQFFVSSANVVVKRFALHLAASLVESMGSTSQELGSQKTLEIVALSLRFYAAEEDDFCLEYLSLLLNKCLEDPQAAAFAADDQAFVQKFFATAATSPNPDVVLHSFEMVEKMLQVQSTEAARAFVALPLFPADRLLCGLTCDFPEIRRAALGVVRTLIKDINESSPLARGERGLFVLQQLTKMFCEDLLNGHRDEVVDVLAAAMQDEHEAQLFFEQNLFERILHQMDEGPLPSEERCRALAIFSASSKHAQFLVRLHTSRVTDRLLDCLLLQPAHVPAAHVLVGLNRLVRLPEAAGRIVDTYPRGLVPKLLSLLPLTGTPIKTREQAAELVGHLLLYAFHKTASEALELALPAVLAAVLGQDLSDLSIDYVLSLLSLVESLAQNADYRQRLAQSPLLTQNLALLLKVPHPPRSARGFAKRVSLQNCFATAVLVSGLFRCLCTLVDEEEVRAVLLRTHIAASIRRALKSPANLVKGSATNFIMQTARFAEFVHEYLEAGVLEALITHQKHSFCVSTWAPAVESILSKSPTLKFIRNQLGFTDITAGTDFLVSKQSFDDFRAFQSILREEVSPLHPVLVVNFERPQARAGTVVSVPSRCFAPEELLLGEASAWCYCKQPGDEHLPQYLEQLHDLLKERGLAENPRRLQRSIDFENVAKRGRAVAEVVAKAMGQDLQSLDLNSPEECSRQTVKCHLRELAASLHSTFIPLGLVRSGCQFERAVLFKALADQIGLPCTLQRTVDGRLLFNELPLPVRLEHDSHCDQQTLKFLPWRLLRPTHVVDLLYNVGELYPLQSRQALQYLRLC